MRQKIVILESTGKVICGAWVDPRAGSVMLGGKIGKQRAVKMLIGESADYQEVGEGRTHFRFRLGMQWEALLRLVREAGLVIDGVRCFRRIIR